MFKAVIFTLVTVCGLGLSAAANAAPVTYSFTGVITSSINALDGLSFGDEGKGAAGSFTFDPTGIINAGNIGINYKNTFGYFINPTSTLITSSTCPGCALPQTAPPQSSGSATGGSLTVAVGGGTAFDYFSTSTIRGTYSEIFGSLSSFDQVGNIVTVSYINVRVSDNSAENSRIGALIDDSFDLNSALDLNFSAGSDEAAFFTMGVYSYRLNGFGSTTPISNIQSNGYLTALKVYNRSVNEVSEPAVLALFSLGLAGIAVARRRKH